MIVALECSGEGFAKRVLSSGPMVYLGKVSYGTYLWHWPLIVLATETLELSPGVMAWSACLIATALASLSFQLLEHPVRKSRLIDRHRFVVIGTGLAISVVSALVLVPAIIDSGSSSGAAPRASTTEGFTPVPSSIDPKAIYLEGFGLPIKLYGKPTEPPDCVNAQPEQCTVVHGTGRHFLLMGDSNAEMMIPAFTKIARENNLTLSLSVKPGCPWQRDVYVNTKEIQDRCRAAKEDAYKRVIPALKPDVMILVTAGGWAGKNPPVTAIDKARTRSLLDATRKSLDALAEGDRDLVIMEPNPEPVTEINPRVCLETAKWLEDCRYIAQTTPRPYEVLTRQLAKANDHVWSANFDKIICPYFPICDPVIDGVAVKWDSQHLTTRFSKAMAAPITAYLRENGLLGG